MMGVTYCLQISIINLYWKIDDLSRVQVDEECLECTSVVHDWFESPYFWRQMCSACMEPSALFQNTNGFRWGWYFPNSQQTSENARTETTFTVCAFKYFKSSLNTICNAELKYLISQNSSRIDEMVLSEEVCLHRQWRRQSEIMRHPPTAPFGNKRLAVLKYS